MISVLSPAPVLCRRCSLAADCSAGFSPENRTLRGDEAKSPWQEVEMPFRRIRPTPALIPLQVGPTATARFFIDENPSAWPPMASCASRSWCAQGGAENVTYEGIRCDGRAQAVRSVASPATGSRRAMSSGVRSEKTANRVHAALAKDYFCPPGVVAPAWADHRLLAPRRRRALNITKR